MHQQNDSPKSYKKIWLWIIIIVYVIGIIAGIPFNTLQHKEYLNQISQIKPTYKANLLGKYNQMNDEFNDIAKSGNYTLIADENNGLDIINTTNSSNPTLISHTSGYSSQKISVDAKIAYLACVGGIRIYNITNPADPVQIGEYIVNNSRSVYELTVTNDIAYITLPFNYPSLYVSVRIVNVSDPYNPVFLGAISVDSVYTHVSVSNNILCMIDLGNNENPCELFNISDFINPKLISQSSSNVTTSLLKEATDAKIIGNILYLCIGSNFDVLNISNPENPVLLEEYFVGANLDLVSIKGNLACLITDWNKISIINVTNKEDLLIYRTFSWNYSINSMIFANNNVSYLIDENGLEIIKISLNTNINIPPFDHYTTWIYYILISIIFICLVVFVVIKEEREPDDNSNQNNHFIYYKRFL